MNIYFSFTFLQCYKRAIAVGDFDGIALLKLARYLFCHDFMYLQYIVFKQYVFLQSLDVLFSRLHERLLEEDEAVKYYTNYVQKAEVLGVGFPAKTRTRTSIFK